MYILACRNARLLRVNLLRLVNVRQAKSSVYLWLPFLIFLFASVIPKRRVSKPIISSLGRIRFSMRRVKVSSKIQQLRYMLIKQNPKSNKGCYTDNRACLTKYRLNSFCRWLLLFQYTTSSLQVSEVASVTWPPGQSRGRSSAHVVCITVNSRLADSLL